MQRIQFLFKLVKMYCLGLWWHWWQQKRKLTLGNMNDNEGDSVVCFLIKLSKYNLFNFNILLKKYFILFLPEDLIEWLTDFVNDNEWDCVANDSNKSNNRQQDSLQDPSYHQELLFPYVPKRTFRSVLHSGISWKCRKS